MFESSYTAAVLEGEQRGEKKKALKIARKLLQAGTLDITTIADMTELTEEEVRAFAGGKRLLISLI
jgi:predicted transposase YdaD